MKTNTNLKFYILNMNNLAEFTNFFDDEIPNSQESQPMSLTSSNNVDFNLDEVQGNFLSNVTKRPDKGTGCYGQFRSIEEIDPKYRGVFTYPFFNVVQSNVIEDGLYSDKSLVVCAPTGSGKTVIFEMAIVQLLIHLEDTHYTDDFKIIYMAPVKALCTERLSEWYPKFTKLGLLCIVVSGDTDVDFSQLKPYRIIITTPEKWDMLTRRWRDHRSLVEVIKLFLIDEVHILNDETRGPSLEVVVSRMKTIESSAQSAHRIEQAQKQYQGGELTGNIPPPRIRFVAVSATVNNPEDVASWIGNTNNPAVFYKFGDECRPVKLKRVVEGYPCSEGTSIFKFDIILNYKLRSVIQKHSDGKPTLIFCNTRKSVVLTAETLSREITFNFTPEQKAKQTALASSFKNKKLQNLILSGIGYHHAGLLFEERTNIEQAFRNRVLTILITTTTLAMGVNLPAHLVIIKNTQQYVNGAYQEYSISTVLQMVGRAGRPQYDTEATAVIMTRLADKARYQALVGGNEPLQSYLHKRLAENLNSEVALGSVTDVAECVQWLRSTFLWVRAGRDPRRYLALPATASQELIIKKMEELCVRAMNRLSSTGLIKMDETSCIESTDAGRLMSIYYIDFETMKNIMKIEGNETLESLLSVVCGSHELADMHLRMDERRCLNALNRNKTASTIRFPMKGKITTRQMKLNCIIQAILGCLPIPDPSLNQEAMKVMRVAERICHCLVAYVTSSQRPQFYSTVLNSLLITKCISAQMWENSLYLSRQLRGIGLALSSLLSSAGKTNFTILKESHPRDLERIMNKGPPAGNVLLKQVCSLPVYIFSVLTIDEKTVSIHLVLQNKSYLADNIGNMTAGAGHKCYVLIGDSENYILTFTSFKDKDLINFYDGSITYKVTRKHDFEHKIYAHCISSNFVGIDINAEYVFQDLRPTSSHIREDTNRRTVEKTQIFIKKSLNTQKKKNPYNIVEAKEKKRQESSVIEKFNQFKEFLTPKRVIESVYNSTETKNNISHNPSNENVPINIILPKTTAENFHDQIIIEDQESDVDDDAINSILNEIESEISHHTDSMTSHTSDRALTLSTPNQNVKVNYQNTVPTNSLPQKRYSSSRNILQPNCKKPKLSRNQTNINLNTNYSFIDKLEKNNDESADDENNIINNDNLGFATAIKPRIDNYLLKTKCNSDSDGIIHKILEFPDDTDIPIRKNKSPTNNKLHFKKNADNIIKIKNTEIIDINNEDKQVDNTIVLSDKEKIPFEEDTWMDNLCIEKVNKCITPFDTISISNKVINLNDKDQSNDNKRLCMRQSIQRKPDFTYNKSAGVVSSDRFVRAKDNEVSKDFASTSDSANNLNYNKKLDNQSRIRIDPNEYTRKNHYTSFKTDVCTKSINEQIIHVVREVKVDLDITEAVYVRNNYNMKNKNQKKDEINTQTVSNTINPIVIKDKLQNISDLNFLPTRNAPGTKNTVNQRNLYNLPNPFEQGRIQYKTQNTSELEKSNVIKSINCHSLMMPTERPQYDLNIHQDNKITEVANISTTDQLQTLPENSSISDIFEKYRKLLQNNSNSNKQYENFTKVNEYNKIKTNKTQKPFSIIEINKVNVSLPKTLIDEAPNQKYIPISQLPIKDIDFYNMFNNEEFDRLYPQNIVSPVLNEECTESNIDQSMFDPKNVLQCLGTENSEIISPTLEYQNNTIKDICMNTSHFDHYQQNVHDSQIHSQNISDLENHMSRVYEPNVSSNQIECWTLSREDSCQNDDLFGSKQETTLTDMKFPNTNNSFQHKLLSRRQILQQFKFKPKEKMKIKRNLIYKSHLM